MAVRLLLPLFLLHAVTLSCPVIGSNKTEGISYTWTLQLQNTSQVENKNVTERINSSPQDIWLTKFVPSIHTVVFLVGFPLNIMAIVMFLVKTKVRKPAVVYMLNLATADVLFVSLLLFRIVYRFSGNNWVIGEGMCRFVTATFYGSMYCSILLMTTISMDRFIAVVYLVRSLTWRTVRRSWLVCGFIWIISFLSTVPLLISNFTFPLTAFNITICYDVLDSHLFKSFYFYYFIPYLSVFFFLPLIITSLCCIGTICSLSVANVARAPWRRRAVYLTAIVLFVFALCFGPSNVIFLIYYLQKYEHGDGSLNFAYILSTSLASVRCCLNPLIYYFSSSHAQRNIYSLLCCMKRVRNRRTTDMSVIS